MVKPTQHHTQTLNKSQRTSGCHLSHCSQKSLRVEEPRDPEGPGTAIRVPAAELTVALDQLREPEAEGARLPRHLRSRHSISLRGSGCFQIQRFFNASENDLRYPYLPFFNQACFMYSKLI